MIEQHRTILHILINYLSVTIIGSLCIRAGIILAIIFSIGKELFDKLNGNLFSGKDLLADTMGIFLGLIALSFIQKEE